MAMAVRTALKTCHRAVRDLLSVAVSAVLVGIYREYHGNIMGIYNIP
jgi:hypothetical protein